LLSIKQEVALKQYNSRKTEVLKSSKEKRPQGTVMMVDFIDPDYD